MKSPFTVTQGPATELGGCNRCSDRTHGVVEIGLGEGRMTFRLCEDCAGDLRKLVATLDLSALRQYIGNHFFSREGLP